MNKILTFSLDVPTYKADGTCGSLRNFIVALLAVEQKVPEEFRAEAKCEIDIDYGYCDSDASLTACITWSREQTPAEVESERLRNESRMAAAGVARFQQEWRTYVTLKQKFEK